MEMAEERYLEWLERADIPIEDTVTLDKLRDYLTEWLGFTPTNQQLDAVGQAVATRYEQLPQVGIEFERIDQKWGSQYVFRDTETGRFVSRTQVKAIWEET